MNKRISHVVGFDDGPFAAEHRGDVLLVGAVFSDTRLQGILCGKIRRDGVNATRTISTLIAESRFFPQLHALLLQGINFAGFNVVNLRVLHETLRLPVIVVSRKTPDFTLIKQALLHHVPGGKRKWHLIEQAGPMEFIENVYVQRLGIERQETALLIKRLAINGVMPEPLRTAHLVAGGITTGESRHRS